MGFTLEEIGYKHTKLAMPNGLFNKVKFVLELALNRLMYGIPKPTLNSELVDDLMYYQQQKNNKMEETRSKHNMQMRSR